MSVPRRRACAVCCHEGSLLLVRLRDPVSGIERHFPPGGGVEPGESPASAAAREVLEETGYRVKIHEESQLETTYTFQWGGKTYECETAFFSSELEGAHSPAPTQDPLVVGVVWAPLAKVRELLSFDSVIAKAVISSLPLGERSDPKP